MVVREVDEGTSVERENDTGMDAVVRNAGQGATGVLMSLHFQRQRELHLTSPRPT